MSQSPTDQLEQQKQRIDALNQRRNRIQVQLETARQQYAEAVAEAQAQHGTSDVETLRANLVKLEADNAKSVADFVQALDDFEAFIVRIESALNDPEVLAALVASMTPVVVVAPTPVAAPVPAAAVAFDHEEI